MAAVRPFCLLLGIDSKKLSKVENTVLEGALFVQVYDALKEYFRRKYKEYFYLLNLTTMLEKEMLENNLIRFIINDILETKEYTIDGIARYAGIHEDIIKEFAAGFNQKPLAIQLRNIIEVHWFACPAMYEAIGKKIAAQYLKAYS